jgi:hypothetical protein
MEVNPVLASTQTKRLRIGNEMNLVAAAGQLNSKLRGNYATAAVRGITGDADFHVKNRFLTTISPAEYPMRAPDRKLQKRSCCVTGNANTQLFILRPAFSWNPTDRNGFEPSGF